MTPPTSRPRTGSGERLARYVAERDEFRRELAQLDEQVDRAQVELDEEPRRQLIAELDGAYVRSGTLRRRDPEIVRLRRALDAGARAERRAAADAAWDAHLQARREEDERRAHRDAS